MGAATPDIHSPVWNNYDAAPTRGGIDLRQHHGASCTAHSSSLGTEVGRTYGVTVTVVVFAPT